MIALYETDIRMFNIFTPVVSLFVAGILIEDKVIYVCFFNIWSEAHIIRNSWVMFLLLF